MSCQIKKFYFSAHLQQLKGHLALTYLIKKNFAFRCNLGYCTCPVSDFQICP